MSSTPRKAFTLVELLVVVAIIAILIGLLFPATRRIRQSADRVRCQNNLKQMMIGILNYQENQPSSDAQAKAFPRGCLRSGGPAETQLSWMVAILPYLEETPLYERFNLDAGYAENWPHTEKPIVHFMCDKANLGEKPIQPLTHYVSLAGLGRDAASLPERSPGIGFMGYQRRTTINDITDGTSNTIALIETRASVGPWARGGFSTLRGVEIREIQFTGEPPTFSGHLNGFQLSMADGSVRFVNQGQDPSILSAGITIAGDDTFQLD